MSDLRILCTGIAVLDEIFRVDEFPPADGKAQASDYVAVGGGCAANAAIAIARLGGQASFAGPLGGPAGHEPAGDRILAGLAQDKVDCSGCVRLDGVASAISAIFVNARGERTIATYRDHRLDAVTPRDPHALAAAADAVLADNRFANFALPICRAALRRGVPVVLDADKPVQPDNPLFAACSHVVFSGEGLRATMRTDDLAAGLRRFGERTNAFLAVTNGAAPVLWRDETDAIRELPVFPIAAVDTLAAGDVFHGAFTLALIEGCDAAAALRFAAAAAGLKCTRFGGSAAAPARAEVDALLRASK
ncbi:MAG TPA: PfkB family carbohydrate kinase [Xanthobacteraceae bacterium]|nr:PfkB family carbohydrate kinase [Xanthobacteraceae bacterium]